MDPAISGEITMTLDAYDIFARPGQISFRQGNGGLAKAHLADGIGNEVEIYLYGAHVTRWIRNSKDLLFLSNCAAFEQGKAIRGGIPLVFPQFGLGTLPAHGFARTHEWRPVASDAAQKDHASITLQLETNDGIAALWPTRFKAELVVYLAGDLSMTLRIVNNGNAQFAFQNAFHTYFAIGDIERTEVRGLQSLDYLDSTRNRAQSRETAAVLTFRGETDRIYLGAPNTITIHDSAGGNTIAIHKAQMSDAVVWNPWADRCKAITDLEDEDFRHFLCVEPGNVQCPIVLTPGQAFECRQTISVT